MSLLSEIANGRTDLVFEFIAAGNDATTKDGNGTSLLQWCAYYGDVSAIKFLLANGASLNSLGDNLDLNGACFHGHWRLCRFLLERGADAKSTFAEYWRVPFARRTLHYKPASPRSGAAGTVGARRESQLRDQAQCGNRRLHA